MTDKWKSLGMCFKEVRLCIRSKRKRLLPALLAACLLCLLLPSTSLAADPSVYFVGFADGNTSNFRVSQLIEVKISGFAPEANLNYYYSTSWDGGWFSFFTVEAMKYSNRLWGLSTCWIQKDTGEKDADDSRFFAMRGNSAQNEWVQVRVVDENPDSATYGKEAIGKINSFTASSLQKDVQNSNYGLFEGESKDVLSLLGEAGIMHIICANSIIDECYISSQTPDGCAAISSGYLFTARNMGIANVHLKMHKTEYCSYHGGNSAEADLLFKIFRKPITTSTPESIILKASSLETDVVYTINDVSKTFDGANDITFDGLNFATEYPITLSYTSNGLTSRVQTLASTKSSYTVSFNTMGHGSFPSVEKKPGETVQEAPAATGYTFLGWYDNVGLTGDNYYNNESKGIHDDTTLFAKWKIHTYTVSFDKQGGGGDMPSQAFTYDTAQELYANAFTRKGYSFLGWAQSPNSADVAYEDSASILNLTAEDNGAVTLYAVWELDRYNILYNKQGHGVFGWSPVDESYEFDAKIPASRDLSEIGYDFRGWYGNAAGTGDDYRLTGIERSMTVYAKWEARRYLAEVSLTLDGSTPYTGQLVQLLQNGKMKYILADSGDHGVYKNANVVMGTYDVFIGGVDTGADMSVDGTMASGSTVQASFFAFTASVELKIDGAAWAGKTVSLKQGGVTAYTLSAYNEGEYSRVLLFPNADSREYDVFINGQDAKTKLTIDNAAGSAKVGYYSVQATVRKDGAAWDNTTLTLQRGGAVRYTLRYDGGVYRTDAVLIEKEAGAELGYDLVVAGAFAGGDTAVDIKSSNRTATVDYYTVTFCDEVNEPDVYATQIVRSGLTGTMPVNPYKSGQTFVRWSNNKNRGQATEAVTSAVTITASWEKPRVINGDLVRCDAGGVTYSAGSYYRLGNLSISGYPGGSATPMRLVYINTYTTAQMAAADSSAIRFVNGGGFTVTDTGTGTASVSKSGFSVNITGVGTSSVKTSIGGAGASVADLQNFLRICMVVNPQNAAGHTIKVRVFGATA